MNLNRNESGKLYTAENRDEQACKARIRYAFLALMVLFLCSLAFSAVAAEPHGIISLIQPDESNLYYPVQGLHRDPVQIVGDTTEDRWLIRRRIQMDGEEYLDLLQAVPASEVDKIDPDLADEQELSALQKSSPYLYIRRDKAYYEGGEYQYADSINHRELFDWDSRTVGWITGLDGRLYVGVSEYYRPYNGFAPRNITFYEQGWGNQEAANEMKELNVSFSDVFQMPEDAVSDINKPGFVCAQVMKFDVEYDEPSGLWCFAVTAYGNEAGRAIETNDALKIRFTVLDHQLIFVSAFRFGTEIRRTEPVRDVYYKRLLRCIQLDENPLTDPVIHGIISDRLSAAGFSDSRIKNILTALNCGEKTYRDLYLLSFFNYGIALDQNIGNSAYSNGMIKIKDSDDSTTSFLHESGHALDGSDVVEGVEEEYLALITFSVNEDVRNRIVTCLRNFDKTLAPVSATASFAKEALNLITPDISQEIKSVLTRAFTGMERAPVLEEADYQELADDLVGYNPGFLMNLSDFLFAGEDRYKKVLQVITIAALGSNVHDVADEAQKEGTGNACMVWDMYSAITDNRVNTILSGKSHSGYVWWDSAGKPSSHIRLEAWAEYFAARVAGDTANIERNAKYFPVAAGDDFHIEDGDDAYPGGYLGYYADLLYQKYLSYYEGIYGASE